MINNAGSLVETVTVHKKVGQSYNAVTDTLGGSTETFTAKVLLHSGNKKGITDVPSEFSWAKGDEIQLGDKYLYVEDVEIAAGAVVALQLRRSK